MKIVIVGGGAAGMFASIAASSNSENEVIILEKNEKLGKKLFITGKGRCNVTNNCSREEFFKNIVKNPKFMYSAFSLFSNIELKKIIEDNGCPLKVERGNRVFPVSDKSSDIINTLKRIINKNGVKVYLNSIVKNIKKESNGFNICYDNNSEKNKCINADKVIITTGGLSYPLTGSTGDGYIIAKKFDLKVNPQYPSLVPFNIKESSLCKDMQGLTLKNVAIKIYEKDNIKNIIYKDFGEMLFTHFGVSGPIILSASCYIENDSNKEYILSIDLKPALSEKELDLRLLREFANYKQKKLKNIMTTLLPGKMIKIFLDRLSESINEKRNDKKENASYVDVENINIADTDKNIRKEIINLLKNFDFTILSKRGFDEAVITRGGIDVGELNPKTLECKKVKDLYFAGEVIDVDALTGGFNIQIAATTGYTAGYEAGKI